MSRFEDSFSEMLQARAATAEGSTTPAPEFLARITRRRARNAGAVVASLLLVVAGAFAAVGAARSDQDNTVAPEPSPTLAPDASHEMMDVYGVDRTSAYVLIRGQCNPEGCLPGLLYTSDAGRTWIRRASPFQVRGVPGSKAYLGGFFATAERGWLFRKEATHETTNGGLSWHVRAELRGVEAIERGSDALWATTANCTAGSCRSFVLRSTDQGRTWSRVEIAGFKVGRVLGINNSAAWIVQDAADGRDFALRRTTDGGRTWPSHASPPAGCDRNDVLFGTTTTLVVVCGSDPAGRTQAKTVWALVAQDPLNPSRGVVWNRQGPQPNEGRLPDEGHLVQMFSAPGGAVWVALDDGALYSSPADSGVGWRSEIGGRDKKLRAVSFPARHVAWVVLDDNTLWRASAGEIKGWEQIIFPSSHRAEFEAMPICTPGPSDNRAPTNEELGHPAVCRVDPKSVTRVPCGGPGQPPCTRPASPPRK